jgi:hypothetical protein
MPTTKAITIKEILSYLQAETHITLHQSPRNQNQRTPQRKNLINKRIQQSTPTRIKNILKKKTKLSQSVHKSKETPLKKKRKEPAMKTMMNPITQSWEQVKPKNVLSALDRT